MHPQNALQDPFPPHRWAGWARCAGLTPAEPFVAAASGGVASQALLAAAAAARPRPACVAVLVEGADPAAEAAVAELCRHLGLPFVKLAPGSPGSDPLDEVCRYAKANGWSTVASGDARGTGEVGGWIGFEARERRAGVALVRPLRFQSRGELRAALERLRLPFVDESQAAARRAHPSAAVGADVLRFDAELAAATAHLVWAPPVHCAARRGVADCFLGGSLPRGALMALPRALRRRALARLLQEGVGTFVPRDALELAVDTLSRGRNARIVLPREWSLVLRSDQLLLEPPRARRGVDPRQLHLPFEEAFSAPEPCMPLAWPGSIALDDGRSIRASFHRLEAACAPLSRRLSVELDASRLPRDLAVRFPRPGDRFHPLGWPREGSLYGFLAAAGVPREGRDRVPLVLADDKVVWVAGLRVADFARVEDGTRQRLRLDLVHPLVPESEAVP